ncbi:hypothetical protein EJB05_32147 [Eragrostis curvula]|uniref:Uncharacterized protein n=1 Tax=Eragrostis curvula TaxID=38414 RepID=A0A5J9UGZ8_9POAL|nr:hypothetical protein EJB05_32147 [Eragrostis curvula]
MYPDPPCSTRRLLPLLTIPATSPSASASTPNSYAAHSATVPWHLPRPPRRITMAAPRWPRSPPAAVSGASAATATAATRATRTAARSSCAIWILFKGNASEVRGARGYMVVATGHGAGRHAQ